ncbi:MAG: hypothetical protein EXS03_09635 [Phycisphaerales bacterium]|nr:hypothetical protein [Phycisphaerales bacterium]
MPIYGPSTSRRVAWKNGLGSTLVLVDDASEQGDDWSYRVSIADVPSRSEFSKFPGVDRWIALLEGSGLAMERGGVRQSLPREGAAVKFSGEETVVGEPLGDGVRDVNLMVRRDRWRGEMQLVRRGRVSVAGEVVIVHARGGAVELAARTEPTITRVNAGETFVSSGEVAVEVGGDGCAVVCVAHDAITLRDATRVWALIG